MRKQQSIFIAIPSYRDKELNKTISSAVYSASGDTFINFGVHNCYTTDEEAFVDTNYPPNISIATAHSEAPMNLGVQRARYIANAFYSGDDYYLQIDAHMRFDKNWDIDLIEQFKYFRSSGIKKPLITGVACQYVYGDDGKTEIRSNAAETPPLAFYYLEHHDMFKKYLIPNQRGYFQKPGCIYSQSVSGAFIFSSGTFSVIESTPNINFFNEEPIISVRAFTHGFDIVSAQKHVVYHMPSFRNTAKLATRRTANEDFPDVWEHQVDNNSKQLFADMLIKREKGRFALGEERSLEEWQEFSGLNYETREITHPAWLV